MNQPGLKGIIFDFNGVIVDDYSLQKEVWSQVSEIVRGKPVTDEEMIHDIRGVPTKATLHRMSQGTLSSEQLDELAVRKTAIARRLFDSDTSLQLMPGLPEFLNGIVARNIPRSIATSQTFETFSHLFDKLALDTWFHRRLAVFDDGTYPGKPAPDIYIKAATLLNLEPIDCVVIEDAQSGIRAAYAAGVRGIVAIGRESQLQELHGLPGVVKAVHNFAELQVGELFG
ncbi:MAG TPA: HAD family phosphatase [Verrucomicrobiae bacterium]|nr:HAD family phosphatase [Verrucomicrobiae bacterium]